ncbi:MAG: RNA 2'-phosphotransferase [Gemmatimonadetes bacterium]|nr:RNA 2'-phosphotransferase [Gemmatimonadota bacterium]
MAPRIVHISKLLSLMLRHRPEEFGLQVDRYGFADLDAVLRAFQDRNSTFTLEDIEKVVYDGEKQRFEIVENRIRARYGHSFSIDLGLDPSEPPEFLYKGVDSTDVERLLSEGLAPDDRDYVHLSFDADVAARLSTRPGRRGSVIRIAATRAHRAGVHFYDCGPTVLTKHIPGEFLDLEQGGITMSQTISHERENVTYGRRRRFSSRR